MERACVDKLVATPKPAASSLARTIRKPLDMRSTVLPRFRFTVPMARADANALIFVRTVSATPVNPLCCFSDHWFILLTFWRLSPIDPHCPTITKRRFHPTFQPLIKRFNNRKESYQGPTDLSGPASAPRRINDPAAAIAGCNTSSSSQN